MLIFSDMAKMGEDLTILNQIDVRSESGFSLIYRNWGIHYISTLLSWFHDFAIYCLISSFHTLLASWSFSSNLVFKWKSSIRSFAIFCESVLNILEVTSRKQCSSWFVPWLFQMEFFKWPSLPKWRLYLDK